MLDAVAEAWAEDTGGENLFANKEVKFLDPFTKSGVFLREVTRRLTIGLEIEIPDLQERVDHILTQQIYGVGITHLTSLLARRSVYCSKTANGEHSIASTFDSESGNIWFERIEHTWKNGKCIYCGATKGTLDRGVDLESHAYAFIHNNDVQAFVNDIFGDEMQFDVIVGNPPYQLSDGGGKGSSAMPIYNLFVEQAKQLNPKFLSMVIPSRWFTGGKGLDEFRASMLNDEMVSKLVDYVIAADVFPGVALKGGACYFLWQSEFRGVPTIETHFKDAPVTRVERPLLERGAEVFIRFNMGVSVLKKVFEKLTGSASPLLLEDDRRFESLVSTRRPFGLESKFQTQKAKHSEDDLTVYQSGGIGYVPKDSIYKGLDLIDSWKVFVGFAAPGTGNKDTFPHKIISTPFIGEPGSICTETYLCIGPFDSQDEAKSVLSYMSCKFTRFLIQLHKPSHNTTRRVYNFVPTQAWNKVWTDEELFAEYKLSDEEIKFIGDIVRPMELE